MNLYAYIVYHELEGAVIENIKRKESDAEIMSQRMAERMKAKSIELTRKTVASKTDYKPTKTIKIAQWLIDSSMEGCA